MLAEDSITKYHKLGSLNHRKLFLASKFWRLLNSRSRFRKGLVPGESPLPGLLMVTFSFNQCNNSPSYKAGNSTIRALLS